MNYFISSGWHLLGVAQIDSDILGWKSQSFAEAPPFHFIHVPKCGGDVWLHWTENDCLAMVKGTLADFHSPLGRKESTLSHCTLRNNQKAGSRPPTNSNVQWSSSKHHRASTSTDLTTPFSWRIRKRSQGICQSGLLPVGREASKISAMITIKSLPKPGSITLETRKKNLQIKTNANQSPCALLCSTGFAIFCMQIKIKYQP